MAQKIVLAELDIDINALLKTTSDLKKEIDALKNTQKDLAASGDKSSEAFVQNEAVLKSLNSAYNSNVKAIQESNQATKTQADQTQLLNMALNTEVTSISEAREQNKLLNKLRNETNTTTAEGQAQVAALNKKLDENNNYIKSNADAYLKQKINIGNYSESIKEAASSINPLNGGLSGFVQRAQEAGGAGNLLKSGLSGMITGMMGMVKASLAFIATPIGAVLAAVGVVIGTLVGLFKSLDPVMDKVEQGFAAISAIIDVVRQTFLSLVTGAKSLKEAFTGFGSSMASAAKEAAKLKEAQQDLADAQRSQEVANAKASQQYDELIVKSKNRTLTEKERIAYIQQAQKIEEANFRQRSALAEAELKNAIEGARIKGQLSDQELSNLKRNTMAYGNYLLNQGRITEKELEAIKKAELGKISIKDETTKRLEKAQNQEDKLAENAQAKREKAEQDAQAAKEKRQAAAEKAIDKAIEKQKAEIDVFIASQGIRAKSLEESVKYEEQLRDKRLAVLEFERKKGKKTQTEYEAEKLEIKNSFLQKQTEATIAQADAELQIFLNANKSKLDANKFLTDELYKQELERLNKVSEAEAAAQTARLVAGTITAEEYNTAIKAIDDKYDADKKALDATKTEEDKAKQAIDLENKLIQTENEFAQKQSDLDRNRAAEIQAAEKTGADVKVINDKYNFLQKQLDNELLNFKLNSYKQTFSMIGSLFGQNTVLGKAAALADVGITTYQKAFESFAQAKVYFSNPLTAPLGVNAAVQGGLTIAQGAVTAAKISGVKFEQGGIQEIGGKRHSAGGTKFWGEDGTMFEAEAGEGIGILNRRAFASFMDFNNSHLGGSSSRGFFAGGGIITQGVKPNTMDLSTITDAIASMPAPVVAVEEIQRVGSRYANVKDNANF